MAEDAAGEELRDLVGGLGEEDGVVPAAPADEVVDVGDDSHAADDE